MPHPISLQHWVSVVFKHDDVVQYKPVHRLGSLFVFTTQDNLVLNNLSASLMPKLTTTVSKLMCLVNSYSSKFHEHKFAAELLWIYKRLLVFWLIRCSGPDAFVVHLTPSWKYIVFPKLFQNTQEGTMVLDMMYQIIQRNMDSLNVVSYQFPKCSCCNCDFVNVFPATTTRNHCKNGLSLFDEKSTLYLQRLDVK